MICLVSILLKPIFSRGNPLGIPVKIVPTL